MQHDWLQGPTIDGRARNLRDDSAGKNFIILHGRSTPRWAQAFPMSRLRWISRISGVAGASTARLAAELLAFRPLMLSPSGDASGWRPPAGRAMRNSRLGNVTKF